MIEHNRSLKVRMIIIHCLLTCHIRPNVDLIFVLLCISNMPNVSLFTNRKINTMTIGVLEFLIGKIFAMMSYCRVFIKSYPTPNVEVYNRHGISFKFKNLSWNSKVFVMTMSSICMMNIHFSFEFYLLFNDESLWRKNEGEMISL